MKTYSQAFSYVQPHVVIFLGDLMDEGSVATEVEYKRYARRLFNIFLKGPSADVKVRKICFYWGLTHIVMLQKCFGTTYSS